MRILILYERALRLDLGSKLLLQFYHEINLRRMNNYQLNIEYATGVCYCCLLKSSVLQNEN